ncbi:hypothetical protein AGDE_11618 [Angomonas deanei]|nr:hypothetical protein AGDE_11618 [Angomonas deanei]|eukprot:EPY25946.1 hypothetical protein AGDE_11618 [Angomonas deanei]
MGSVLFASFFSQHKYVWVFVITTVLQMAGSIFDLIIVKRWNIAIGIPDHAMYLMGDSIVYEICFVFSIMPQQILMSRLCPRGTESMSFALLAGISSAGNSLSGVIGSLMMEFKWPVYNTKKRCDFSNLPYLIIVGHLCLPILIVPLAFLLLPNARICDVIDKNGKVVKSGKIKRR